MKNTIRLLGLILSILFMLPTVPALAGDALALQPQEAIHGFQVLEVYDSTTLNSTICTFEHPYSGAKLTCVLNDDPEVAFCIGYKTPYIDETDSNHVFEHAIIAGSEKYPAKDIFFDLANRSYSTFINATTNEITTRYPISSMSEDQLLKLMDVYLSCMVAPTVLTDERIFQREAIRFELDDPDGDIAVNGTVFAEDTGFMTDIGFQSMNNVANALYPGEIAANRAGRAYEHYDDLTFEHTVDTYERCYHFDNCMIFLYGDLDLDRFLSFLDEEYLSKYPASGTDLSKWKDGVTPSGFVNVQCPVPAYEGDAVENASSIVYAIDLDGASEVELCQYGLLASLLNIQGSPLYNARIERGIENPVSAGVMSYTAKPFFLFSMRYANPEQKDDLKSLAEDALSRVSSDGIDPEMMRVLIKSTERYAKLTRNDVNVGVGLESAFIESWARSGELNYYRVYEQALQTMAADGQQQLLRNMALALLTPRRSALVTSVPTPGLAEQHDQALQQYLADMKASMSPEELQAMAAQTAAFNAWNAEEQHNNDFLIPPSDLPDPTSPSFTKEQKDSITVYRGETSLEGVCSSAVYFDLSGMSREELEYLSLTSNYLGRMGTDRHTPAELTLLIGEYTSSIQASFVYPTEACGSNHRPMYVVSWSSLTEDYDESLDLVLELFTRTNYRDADMLNYLTQMNAEAWDMSRQSGDGIAQQGAYANAGLNADTRRFSLDVNGQDCYTLIADAAKRLNEEEGFADEFADHFENTIHKAFNRDNLILMVAAPVDAMDGVVDQTVSALQVLPEHTADAEYALPDLPETLAICVESSVNYSFLVGNYLADADFVGSYLPFVYALNDLYTVPTFRFSLGAYSASTSHQWAQGTLTTHVYSDPNVASTVQALRAIPEAIKDMNITGEMLDGYILKAYGNATSPMGMINEVMNAMHYDILGMDAERTLRIKSDIRNAKPDQMAEAAEHIGRVFDHAALCTAGNESLIRADADCFDAVISYRHSDPSNAAVPH